MVSGFNYTVLVNLLTHFSLVDQKVINVDIEKLRLQQKVLVNKLRDLEREDPLKGFDLKPMAYGEMSALKANLR